MNSLRQWHRSFLTGRACLSLWLIIGTVRADMITDGSLGGRAQALSGPDYWIPETLGSRQGHNLFHSFSQFNLLAHESARFTGAADLRNVVTRVTGGAVSNINGLLRSEIAGADFYFINPAGVVFGPQSRVEVPAAFHVSTADYLEFTDQQRFAAANPQDSTLSVASPDHFGFAGGRQAEIRIDQGQLSLNQKNVTLSAPAIEFRNVDWQGQDTRLSVAAIGQEPARFKPFDSVPAIYSGVLNLQGSMLRLQGAHSALDILAGHLQLTNATLSLENAEATAAQGMMQVRVGDATLSNAQLLVASTGPGAAPPMDISVRDRLKLEQESRVFSYLQYAGDAAPLSIHAQHLDLTGTSFLGQVSDTSSSGNGSVIDIQVPGTISVTDSGIMADSFGRGHAGSLWISAGQIQVRSDEKTALISSNTHGGGQGGEVHVTARDIDLERSSSDNSLSASISSVASGAVGDAGSVVIRAENLRLGYGGFIFDDSRSAGHAGSVDVQANDILLQGGIISSNSQGIGKAGEIDIRGQNLTITQDRGLGNILTMANVDSASAGHISLQLSGSLKVEQGAYISSDTLGSGPAGNIEVQARDIQITNGSSLTSSTYGAGSAGTIKVRGETLTMDGGDSPEKITGITSYAYANAGAAGQITLDVHELRLTHGAMISTDTYGQGRAGNIDIRAVDITADSRGPAGHSQMTGISSESGDGAQAGAGTILIAATGSLRLLGDASISSGTYSNFNAGNVRIEAQNLLMDTLDLTQGNGIGSQAKAGLGSAGDIHLKVIDRLDIRNGAAVSSASFASGNAGQVTVAAGHVVIDAGHFTRWGTAVTSETHAGSTGLSGKVSIDAQDILIQGANAGISIASNAVVDASQQQAAAGHLLINADRLEIRSGSILSSSEFNAPASSIQIHVREWLSLQDAFITTTANQADGGGIHIDSRTLIVDNSLVTTSVLGPQGNGGPIQLQTRALVMDSGFIQANTAAAQAKGGDIDLRLGNFVFPNDSLVVGGQEHHEFVAHSGINVIQAAAPTGVSGAIDIQVPSLHPSSNLLTINTDYRQLKELQPNPCQMPHGEAPSSLIFAGRGALPRSEQQALDLPVTALVY